MLFVKAIYPNFLSMYRDSTNLEEREVLIEKKKKNYFLDK